MVREDDTYHVLSAEPWPRAVTDPIESVLAELAVVEPATAGTIVVREGSPLELLAVVHDLEREPSWREAWIASALAAALREAEMRSITSVAVPILGTRYGSADPRRVLGLLGRALQAGPIAGLRNLWLLFPPEASPDGLGALDAFHPEVRL